MNRRHNNYKDHPISRSCATVVDVLSVTVSRIQASYGSPHLKEFILALDETLAYLAEAQKAFARSRRLSPIELLVSRAVGAFETGVLSVSTENYRCALNAMRDVMEIEYLLSDFLHTPQNLQDWFGCDDRARWKRFQPVKLRERKANRLETSLERLSDTRDYKSHSEILHILPRHLPLIGYGICDEKHEAGFHIALSDIVEHAWRFVLTVHSTRRRMAPHHRTGRSPKWRLQKLRNLRRACLVAQWIALAGSTSPIPSIKEFTADPVI